MTKTDAMAEVFCMALKSLSKPQRDAVLVRIARDKALSRDLLDLATVAATRHEPSRPFRVYLKGKGR